MKIDWVRKLTSRKFWAAVCNFVMGMVVAFGGTEELALKITGLIMSGATVIAYIIAEGLVDKSFNDSVITIPAETGIDEQQPPQE